MGCLREVSIEHGKIHPSTAEPGTWRGGCPASRKRLCQRFLRIVAWSSLRALWNLSFPHPSISSSRPDHHEGCPAGDRAPWGVERSLAWMMHAHRHARDYEWLAQHSETLITWAAITLTGRLRSSGSALTLSGNLA